MNEINFTKVSEPQGAQWTGLIFRPVGVTCSISTSGGNVGESELTAAQIDKYLRPLALELLQADAQVNNVELPTGAELVARAEAAKAKTDE